MSELNRDVIGLIVTYVRPIWWPILARIGRQWAAVVKVMWARSVGNGAREVPMWALRGQDVTVEAALEYVKGGILVLDRGGRASMWNDKETLVIDYSIHVTFAFCAGRAAFDRFVGRVLLANGRLLGAWIGQRDGINVSSLCVGDLGHDMVGEILSHLHFIELARGAARVCRSWAKVARMLIDRRILEIEKKDILMVNETHKYGLAYFPGRTPLEAIMGAQELTIEAYNIFYSWKFQAKSLNVSFKYTDTYVYTTAPQGAQLLGFGHHIEYAEWGLNEQDVRDNLALRRLRGRKWGAY